MGIGRRIETQVDELQQQPKQDKTRTFLLKRPKYAFSDLILPLETRDQISKAMAFRLHHDLVFEKWGLKGTHRNARRVCLNFYGPPGTGKTMAAHAVAHALDKQLLIVNYAEIESKYVGETPKNLSAAFEFADKEDAVIFFDEADALLSKRVTNMSNSTDLRRRWVWHCFPVYFRLFTSYWCAFSRAMTLHIRGMCLPRYSLSRWLFSV